MPDNEEDERGILPTGNEPQAVSEYDDPDNHKYNEISSEHKALLDQVLVFGFDYLRVMKGWTLTAAREFLGRAECLRYLKYQQEQYVGRAGVQERTQFFGTMKIHTMVPLALNIVTRALVGTKVKPNGEIEVRAPDRGQFDAACLVLELSGIKVGKSSGDTTLPPIDARSVTVNVGATTEKMNLSPAQRSRVTKTLQHIVAHLQSGTDAEQRIANRANLPKVAVKDDDEAPRAPVRRRSPPPREE